MDLYIPSKKETPCSCINHIIHPSVIHDRTADRNIAPNANFVISHFN